MHPVILPQINVNDSTAVVDRWLVEDRQHVSRGELLCIFETSKAVAELEAPIDGYVRILVQAGDTVEAGQTLAVIADAADADISALAAPQASSTVEPIDAGEPGAGGRRVTVKARLLAESHQIDLQSIPGTGRVTESDITAYLRQSGTGAVSSDDGDPLVVPDGIKRVLLIGGGKGAPPILDVISRIEGMAAVGIVDDSIALQGSTVGGIPVIGTSERLEELWSGGVFDEALVTFADGEGRRRLFEKGTAAGIPFANVIDPSALVCGGVSMGQGVVVMGQCRVGPGARIGDNIFLSAMVNVEHDCVVGDHTTFGPGVFLSGFVHVGRSVRFGTLIGVEPDVTIGDGAVIASGLAVTADVPAGKLLKAFHGRV